MKKIIVLRGAGNKGKSTTLKMVYRSLKASYDLLPEANVQPDKRGIYRHNQQYDLRAIFVVNGLRLGLETQGDPGSRLEDSLQFFRDNNCTLIVCPTRTFGITVKHVERLRPEFEIEWIKKTIASDEASEASCNKADAAQIMMRIQEFLFSA